MLSESWEELGPAKSKSKERPAPPTTRAGAAPLNGRTEVPQCPNCNTKMEEVHQLNEQGSLGWGFAGHASNRLYLMGMIRESGMAVKTARLRAYCCPKCRRGEFRY